MEGIIYKIIDYKESSSICYLYTEEGLDSVLVLGAKKYKSNNMPFCEILNHVTYTKTNSELPKLIDYEVINKFRNIKNSLTKLKYATIILEVLRQVIDIRTARIFKFSIDILNKIDEGFDPISICFIYLAKMLKVYGILPDLDKNTIYKFSNIELLKEAYYTKDYNLIVSKEDLINLIGFYNKVEAINCYNIYKILEDNL